MRVNRGLLGWGVFFIVLGAVPLGLKSGALDAAAVSRAWELWPLILVGIGLRLLLVRTRFAIIGGLVVAVTFGLMAGSLVATGMGSIHGFGSCGIGSGSGAGPAFPSRTGAFTGDATVNLEMNCGDVDVTAADGPGWSVAGTSDGGRSPDIAAGDARLTVQAPGKGGIELMETPWRWQVTLPRTGAMTVDLSVNAGSGRFDLAGMMVPALEVSVNAGSGRVDMSATAGATRIEGSANAGSLSILLPTPTGTLTGSVSVNAGSASLCAPAGVALRFRGGNQALGSNNFGDRGLVHIGDTWSTPGFDSATARIDLGVSANLGSVTLNPEDGCD